MSIYGRLRGSVIGAITRSPVLSLPPVISRRNVSPAIYKRLLSTPAPQAIRRALQSYKPAVTPRPRSTYFSSSSSPFFCTPTLGAQRLYSTGKTAPATSYLYFRPTTWLVIVLSSCLFGVTYILIASAGFIAYTDEESLRGFMPSSPKEFEIEEYINNHLLAISMRSKPNFTESRPTLKVGEKYRNRSLTSGVLSGPGKIEVPPYVWSEAGGKSYVSIMYLGSEMCGHPGLIHGGLLATLLDEGLARCCFPALPNQIGMTANLTINYRNPSPAKSFVVLRARTVKVEGRKAWVEGHIETLPKNGEEPIVLVEASALMIEPRQARMLRILAPVK